MHFAIFICSFTVVILDDLITVLFICGNNN